MLEVDVYTFFRDHEKILKFSSDSKRHSWIHRDSGKVYNLTAIAEIISNIV